MYSHKYHKYKAKYLMLKGQIQRGGVNEQSWPILEKSCNTNNPIKDDECYRSIILMKDDPFFGTDAVDRYTNTGFYTYWGNNVHVPTNVNFVTVYNVGDIVDVMKKIKNGQKVIVKNSGHDYIGRSYPKDNTLVIWTHFMDKMYWKRERLIIDEEGLMIIKPRPDQQIKCFMRDCKCIDELKKNIEYCTVAAGVQWYKIFDYMNKNIKPGTNELDSWAMKGASNTVGAAGGWILDGGFGLFTK